MFTINADKSIYLTRGDIAVIEVFAANAGNTLHTFKTGDIIRLDVFEKNRHDSIVLRKDVVVESEVSSVDISLHSSDTRIGETINKPKDYWYEIQLNPDTMQQTLIGYDNAGPKIFRLFPEGDDDSGHLS